MGTAPAGVGAPAALIAVIAAVCWKIVCASLVPKYRVPELPAETGFPVRRYVAFGWVAVPVHGVAVPEFVAEVYVIVYPLLTGAPPASLRSGLMNGVPPPCAASGGVASSASVIE